jgi:hypothetical protein
VVSLISYLVFIALAVAGTRRKSAGKIRTDNAL